MKVELTKLSNDRHRLTIRRDDGSAESVELETRSYLLHDLVHYAVEAEAKIADGFWGLLARGTTLAELSDRKKPPEAAGPGIALAESLVGPMQSVFNGRLDPALYVEQLGSVAPAIVDEAFVDRVCERLRKLTSFWRKTRFHEPMVLDWPPP